MGAGTSSLLGDHVRREQENQPSKMSFVPMSLNIDVTISLQWSQYNHLLYLTLDKSRVYRSIFDLSPTPGLL